MFKKKNPKHVNTSLLTKDLGKKKILLVFHFVDIDLKRCRIILEHPGNFSPVRF